jgi:hypothetical protein
VQQQGQQLRFTSLDYYKGTKLVYSSKSWDIVGYRGTYRLLKKGLRSTKHRTYLVLYQVPGRYLIRYCRSVLIFVSSSLIRLGRMRAKMQKQFPMKSGIHRIFLARICCAKSDSAHASKFRLDCLWYQVPGTVYIVPVPGTWYGMLGSPFLGTYQVPSRHARQKNCQASSPSPKQKPSAGINHIPHQPWFNSSQFNSSQ